MASRIITFSLLIFLAGPTVRAEEVSDIELAALRYARAMDSARVRYRISIERPSKGAVETAECESVFESLKFKCIWRSSLPVKEGQSPTTWIHNRLVTNSEEMYFWGFDEVDPTSVSRVAISQLEPAKDLGDERMVGAYIVPQTFGTQMALALTSRRIDAVVGNPDRDFTEVSDENVNGVDLVRVVYKEAPSGRLVMLWFDPDKGPSLVKGEIREGYKSLVMEAAELEVEEFDGWYYPRRFSSQSRSADGELDYIETVEVLEAEFNLDIDDSEFTLVGIAPPDGHRIYRAGHESRYWDASLQKARYIDDGRAAKWWFYALAAGAAAALALLILWRMRRAPPPRLQKT